MKRAPDFRDLLRGLPLVISSCARRVLQKKRDRRSYLQGSAHKCVRERQALLSPTTRHLLFRVTHPYLATPCLCCHPARTRKCTDHQNLVFSKHLKNAGTIHARLVEDEVEEDVQADHPPHSEASGVAARSRGRRSLVEVPFLAQTNLLLDLLQLAYYSPHQGSRASERDHSSHCLVEPLRTGDVPGSRTCRRNLGHWGS